MEWLGFYSLHFFGNAVVSGSILQPYTEEEIEIKLLGWVMRELNTTSLSLHLAVPLGSA